MHWLVCSTIDFSNRSSPSRLDFEYLKEGDWLERYGVEWGAFQLLLMSIRSETSSATNGHDEPLGPHPNFLTSSATLIGHQVAYVASLNRQPGQDLLLEIFSRFRNIRGIKIGTGDWENIDRSLNSKRHFIDWHGAKPKKDSALHQAAEFCKNPRIPYAGEQVYDCIDALLCVLPKLDLKLNGLGLYENDSLAFSTREWQHLLVNTGTNFLTLIVIMVLESVDFDSDVESWRQFLRSAKSLKRLRLEALSPPIEPTGSSHCKSAANLVENRLKDLYFPQLEEFHVESFTFFPLDVSDFIICHAKTLKRLLCGPIYNFVSSDEEDDDDVKFYIPRLFEEWREVTDLDDASLIVGDDAEESINAMSPEKQPEIWKYRKRSSRSSFDLGDYLVKPKKAR